MKIVAEFNGFKVIVLEGAANFVDGEYFFNTQVFMAVHPLGELLQFILLEKETNTVVASICFDINDNSAVSLSIGTFAGLELQQEIPSPCTTDFVVVARDYLLYECSVGNIIIKQWPMGYNPRKARDINITLCNAGFQTTALESNQTIGIEEGGLLHCDSKSTLLKLRRGTRAGLIAEGPFSVKRINFDHAYRLIVESRVRKNFPVNIDHGRLYHICHELPDRYLFFPVYDDDIMVAVAVTIVISKDVLYNFLHADDAAYLPYSPILLAIDKVLEYGHENHFGLLDLGISSDNSVLNEGLYEFKKRVGGEDSLKINWQYSQPVDKPA